jgi:recombination protein RecA
VSPPAPDLYGASAGKLLELSGQGNTARTSTAVALLRAAQATGDTAAWIQPEGGPLYPPDLAEAGIDLEALVVIHVPRTAGPHGPCRAAELLLRSGAFGFVAIDLCEGAPPGPAAPWQGRLLGLARQHHARLVLLTHKPDTSDSLGPLVGLRLAPRRRRLAHGRYVLELAPLRNKSGTPLPGDGGLHRAPWGLP